MQRRGICPELASNQDNVNALITAGDALLPESYLGILHHNENICDQCGEKFTDYNALITHARHVHHDTIVKCDQCGKEFIHEKDRLHHSREEHKQKIEAREHKDLHKHDNAVHTPQQEVDAHRKNFSDSF